MNDKLTTSTKRDGENMLSFNWEIVTHFGNFSCSNWKKKILFSFGNDTGNRSRFHREKNHCVKNGTGSSLADPRNKRVVLGRYKNAGRYLLLVMSQKKLHRAYVVCFRNATLNKASLSLYLYSLNTKLQ